MDLFTDKLLSRRESYRGTRKERVRHKHDMNESILMVWIKFIFWIFCVMILRKCNFNVSWYKLSALFYVYLLKFKRYQNWQIKSLRFSFKELQVKGPNWFAFPIHVELFASPDFFEQIFIELKLVPDTLFR